MNTLTLPLAVAFLFGAGATFGWVLEFFFRNLISHKGPRGKYFINPGLCKGPWLPIYGVGLSAMCIISELVKSYMDPAFVESVTGTVVIILCLGLTMIAIEFLGGLFLLDVLNIRLWDYRDRLGNYRGIVCPLFSLIWTSIAALYYLFIHEIALREITWFSENLAFSFFVGLFTGVFVIDLASSMQQASIIRKVAKEHDAIVELEKLKAMVQAKLKEEGAGNFFNQVAQRGTRIEASIAMHESALVARAEAFRSRRSKKHGKRKK